MAEVDGNRTRRTGNTRPDRFEGGGTHQACGHLRPRAYRPDRHSILGVGLSEGGVILITDTVWEARGEELSAAAPGAEFVVLGESPVSDADIDRLTIAFFSSDAWPGRTAALMGPVLRAPRLEWLHTFSAGLDDPVFARLTDRGVLVTNSPGAAAPAIAHSVIHHLITLIRELDEIGRDRDRRRWHHRVTDDPADLRLGIIGLGSIGSEVARLATAMGMDVVGLRRHPTGTEPCATWAPDRLGDLLARSDALVMCAPLTDETRDMLGADEFASMPRGSYFVNVGRGECVDESALIDALRRGHLAGAALDVFAVEPLPEDSPLWDMERVIITPHSSGSTHRSARRAEDTFLDLLAQTAP